MTTTISGSSWQVDASCDDQSADSDVAVASQPWQCRIARTRARREAAFRLIYGAYLRSGLGVANSFGMRVTPFHLLSTTAIFTAELTTGPEAGLVFSTVSLVGDGEYGLPLEKIYPDEVAQRRDAGLRLAEVSCLADRRQDFRRFFPVFVALNRWMIQYADAQGMDQVLIAVHPKHARFYTRNLGFEAIGELKEYSTVCESSRGRAVFRLRAHSAGRFSEYYDQFFSNPIPRRLLQPAPLSDSERSDFARMIDPAFHDLMERAAAGNL